MLRGLLAFALIASTQAGQLPARDSSVPQTGTSVVRGRLVSATTGEPLRKARVSLSSVTDPVFTDNEGRFAFTNLAAGRYTLSARKTGYAATTFGAGRPGSPPISIDVAAGSVIDGIEVRMPRGAAISGRITDQFGDPVEMAAVFARRIVHAGGRIDTVVQASTATDDLGEYRLGGLPAGSFVVSAVLPNSRSAVFVSISGMTPGTAISGSLTSGTIAMSPGTVTTINSGQPPDPTYYPGVPGLSRAQAIPLRAGEEASSIDFTVTPVKLATVSIALVDSKGDPAQGVASLSRIDESGLGSAGRLVPGPRGNRMKMTLEPGEWTIYVRGDHSAGMARFSVGSDDVSMTVPLTPGGSIRGRVVWDGTSLPPNAGVEIDAVPVEPAMAGAPAMSTVGAMRPDGTFAISGLLGLRELRVKSAPPGWLLKALVLEGRSLIDAPIALKDGEIVDGVQVVLTNRLSTLKGTVTDAARTPVRDSSVLIFPEDAALQQRARSLARWVRPNQAGEFVADDLLPGAYLAVAVGDVDESRWPDADYLAQFRARATRIVLGESETKTMVLQIGTAP